MGVCRALSNNQQVAATTEEVNVTLEEMSSLAVQLDTTIAQLYFLAGKREDDPVRNNFSLIAIVPNYT